MSGGQLSVFLKRADRPLLKFYMKIENLQGQKLIEPIYFCFLKNSCFGENA